MCPIISKHNLDVDTTSSENQFVSINQAIPLRGGLQGESTRYLRFDVLTFKCLFCLLVFANFRTSFNDKGMDFLIFRFQFIKLGIF